MRRPAPRGARDWIDWPFFEPRHRALAERLDAFIASRRSAMRSITTTSTPRAASWCAPSARPACSKAAVASPEGDASGINSRSACLARETLAWRDGLADFAFAMQGLGSGAIAIAGSPELKRAVLPKTRSGRMARRLRVVREGRGLRRRGDGRARASSKAIIT